jgi:hypothetical protein
MIGGCSTGVVQTSTPRSVKISRGSAPLLGPTMPRFSNSSMICKDCCHATLFKNYARRNMKKEIGKLDATPSKRTFLSIIADYDLNRSICELIDNGLDVWVRGGKAKTITIKVTLDEGQQTITVEDNAGGLPKHELRYIVGPGQTGTSPTEQTIGKGRLWSPFSAEHRSRCITALFVPFSLRLLSWPSRGLTGSDSLADGNGQTL